MANSNFKTFAVKFFDEALQKDFLDMIERFNSKEEQIICTERNETYEVTAVEGKMVVWELAMHKYMSYAKDTIPAGKSGKRIQRVWFSFASLLKEENIAG
ncbi:MAG: hypothetical protein HFJ46_03925 [Clostridia bacterium]|jgi:hypothetical protein|nr:hypothetical protein [Clostridia bacterium]